MKNNKQFNIVRLPSRISISQPMIHHMDQPKSKSLNFLLLKCLKKEISYKNIIQMIEFELNKIKSR